MLESCLASEPVVKVVCEVLAQRAKVFLVSNSYGNQASRDGGKWSNPLLISLTEHLESEIHPSDDTPSETHRSEFGGDVLTCPELAHHQRCKSNG